jgi:hypothetical protein
VQGRDAHGSGEGQPRLVGAWTALEIANCGNPPNVISGERCAYMAAEPSDTNGLPRHAANIAMGSPFVARTCPLWVIVRHERTMH